MSPNRLLALVPISLFMVPALAAGGSLAEALDSPGLTWQAGGDRVWQVAGEAQAQAGGDVAEVRLDGPPGGWFGGDCLTSWIETTVTGPGTMAVAVRHNFNPYTRVSLLVDGEQAEIWDIPPHPNGRLPNSGFSEWRRLTAVVPAGQHIVRLVHEFGCNGVGTLYIDQPRVQADNARLLPLPGPLVLEALDLPPESPWLAGGAVDFQILLGADAHDGVDAVRAPAVWTGTVSVDPTPPWLRHEVTGPVTLEWWERAHPPSPSQPWMPHRVFVPPGEHVFRWDADATGRDLDAFSKTDAPEIALNEALESGDREFMQQGAPWRGVRTSAAPDGEDAAWVRVTPAADSWLETTVDGPATVSFRYSTGASIESGGHLVFSINDRPVTLLEDGAAITLPAGQHQVRWKAFNFSSAQATLLLDALRVAVATEIGLGPALDTEGLPWTSGPVPWSGLTTAAAPDGTDGAFPPELRAGETAWMETTVAGPGRLSFRWPLADQPGFSSAPGPLQLIIDGRQILDQSVFQTAPVVEVGPGSHTFRWLATGQSGWRLAVVDQVAWEPMAERPWVGALEGPVAPMAAPNGTSATVVTDTNHDGVDSVRLTPVAGPFSWNASASLWTWIEGPGHLFFWYRSAAGSALEINGVQAISHARDGDWHRGILPIAPGWRRHSWGVSVNLGANPTPSVWLDEMSFVPTVPIPLQSALPGVGPWRTSPGDPWIGMPADFVLNTFSSAQAPAAAVSWIETDVTGPTVLTFRATGYELGWHINGQPAGQASRRTRQVIPYAIFVPAGSHTVRWTNAGHEPAILAEPALHALPGDLALERAGDSLLIRVPRPAGFADWQISLQYIDPSSGSTSWSSDFSSRIQESESTAVTFSVPLQANGVLREEGLWRAAFTP